MVMRRIARFLSKVTETPLVRSWGAMRCSSLESASGDFGQRGEAAVRLPTVTVSSSSRSVADRVQSSLWELISRRQSATGES